MRVTQITQSKVIKFKTFDFSSSDILISVTAELDGDDLDMQKASEQLTKDLVKSVYKAKAIWDDVDPQIYMKPACLR